MIRSFSDRDTERLYDRQRVKRFQAIEDACRKSLRLLSAATSLNDLRTIPGNRLEKLPEFGPDTYSIRINERYRVLFRWIDGAAEDVKITDHYKP